MNDKSELGTLLGSSRISRRDFIQRAIAVGVTATAASSMFDSAQAATPKKGGHYINTLTGGATTDVLDPAQTLDSYMINVSFGQLRNNLTEIGPDGQAAGELAESYEASDDGKTWRFKLRSGVEFHNGKSLEAGDVVATFNHHRGEGNKSAASELTKQISDVKADGKNIVEFTLASGNADWPFIVSDYHLCVCPANDDGSIDWQSGVGTGGYKLEKFDPGVTTLVKRNENYWKEGRAWFDSIENLFIADATARTTAVTSGSAHSMSNLDLKVVHLLKRNPDVRLLPITGNKHAVLPMFTDTAPFDNIDVRLALKYAINREELVKKIVFGHGEIGNDTPIGPANIYRATPEELPQRPYDPDQARFHLKKAGMAGATFDLSLADTAFEGALDAGQLFAESVKAAGFNLNIIREANDGYWSNVWLKKPFVGGYWGGRATEDWIFSQIYAAGAEWNETHWDNKRFNELLILARSELDDKKRRDMYVEMQQLCHDDGGVIVPMFMAYTHLVSKKIGMPDKIANNWELDGHKNAERWWMA